MDNGGLPLISLTFNNSKDAYYYIESMEQAKEVIIWEQRVMEDSTIRVSTLSTKSLADQEEEPNV